MPLVLERARGILSVLPFAPRGSSFLASEPHRVGRRAWKRAGWKISGVTKLLLQHLQLQAFSLCQHPHRSITERRLCVDYEILIACPPHFNCIPEGAKLSQYGAAVLLFSPRRTEKLERQEGKAHTRNKWRGEVEMAVEGAGIA